MTNKKDLICNELINELISIRVDTLWRMLSLKAEARLPKIEDEGATGELDNKGAIFIPGGLIYEDVDGIPISYEGYGQIGSKEFRQNIRTAMHYDNATLIYPDGIATGVNLNNGFFSRAARRVFAYKKAAVKRKKKVSGRRSLDLTSDDITRSHCPNYIKEPYGTRTKLSSCISVGLIEPLMYYIYCRAEFGLNQAEEKAFSAGLDAAQKPIIGKDETVLSPPYIVVCHDTRYRQGILTGIIRILGIGKFGEFATITLEEATKGLLQETRSKKAEFSATDLFTEYQGLRVVCILRIYAPTTPGKRSSKMKTMLVSPSNDLDLDLSEIEMKAKARYRIK